MDFCEVFKNMFSVSMIKCCHSPQKSIGNFSLSSHSPSSSMSFDETVFQNASLKMNPIKDKNTSNLETCDTLQGNFQSLNESLAIDSERLWKIIDNNDIDELKNIVEEYDLNSIQDFEGFSPLHRSIIAGNDEMSLILVEVIDLEVKDRLKRTALHYACMKNQKLIVTELIKHGANTKIIDKLGKLPENYCNKSIQDREVFNCDPVSHDSTVINQTVNSNGNSKAEKICTDDSFNEGDINKDDFDISELFSDSFNKTNNLTKSNSATQLSNSEKIETGNKKHRKLTGPVDETKKTSLICDYKPVKVLSQNAVGEVYLIQHKSSQFFYTMKVIEKEKINSQGLHENVSIEKKILTSVKSPFICPLLFSFQTSDKLLLIKHYCPRGTLLHLINKYRKLDLSLIKTYCCEIVLALEVLHDQDFAYLNLRPSNLLINSNGHVMLNDFSLAKIGTFQEDFRLFRGNTKYASPEMVKSLQCGIEADWYLLGLLLFQMSVGVLYDSKKIGKMVKDPELADLIQKLTEQDIRSRLTTAKSIKEHIFFNGVDWKKIEKLQISVALPENADVSSQKVNISLEDDLNSKFPLVRNWTFYGNN